MYENKNALKLVFCFYDLLSTTATLFDWIDFDAWNRSLVLDPHKKKNNTTVLFVSGTSHLIDIVQYNYIAFRWIGWFCDFYIKSTAYATITTILRQRTFKVRKFSLKVHLCNKNFGSNVGPLHPKTATNLALHEYLIALSKYHPGQACNMRKLGFSRLHETDNADNLGWCDNNESLI